MVWSNRITCEGRPSSSRSKISNSILVALREYKLKSTPPQVTVAPRGVLLPTVAGAAIRQSMISLRVSPEHILTENAVFCTVGLRHRMPRICCL